MQALRKTIMSLTTAVRTVALLTMFSMMVFIFMAVLSRLVFHPMVGDIELVQLGMVVLIMCGLAYTEQVKGHISIDLIVERFPRKVRLVLDIVAYLLTMAVTGLIVYTYMGVAYEHQYSMRLSTDLLSIPYFPFDWIIVFGFFSWGLEAFLGLIDTLIAFSQKEHVQEEQ